MIDSAEEEQNKGKDSGNQGKDNNSQEIQKEAIVPQAEAKKPADSCDAATSSKAIKDIRQNEPSELISQMLITTPIARTLIDINPIDGPKVCFMVEYGNREPLAEKLKSIKQEFSEDVGLTADLLEHPMFKEGYKLVVGLKEKKGKVIEVNSSWGHMKDAIRFLSPAITDISNGAKKLIQELTIDDIINSDGMELLPEDVMLCQGWEGKKKIAEYFYKDGSVNGRPSAFEELINAELTSPKIFETGIPTRLLIELQREIDKYQFRGVSYSELAQALREKNDSKALPHYENCYIDLMRIRKMYKFMLTHEPEDDLRKSDQINARRKMAFNYQNRLNVLYSTALFTGDYEKADRFAEIAVEQITKMMDESKKIEDAKEEGITIFYAKEAMDEMATTCYNIKAMKQDIARERKYAVFQRRPFARETPAMMELDFDERHDLLVKSDKYDLAKPAKKQDDEQNKKDPLYLKTAAPFSAMNK